MGSNLTPMMRQYRRVKDQIPAGALLLFRLGDFYEMFHDDARAAAPILDIALTKRNGVPMCGVPYHAADGYIARLVRAGYKVAICDQVEDPSKAGQIVRRELTEVVTAGTTTSESILQPGRNNYLMACLPTARRFGLGFLDVSTGEFRAAELDTAADVVAEISRWAPSECLLPERVAADETLMTVLLGAEHGAAPTMLEDEMFSAENAEFLLAEHFGTGSLAGFGLADMPAAVGACGAILAYLRDVLHRSTAHITSLGVYDAGRYVGMDRDTQRNLDLVEDARTGRREGSLLGVVDESVTPMGGRTLRSWVLRPLRDPVEIRVRQEAVRWLVGKPGPRALLREALHGVRDLQRTASRVGSGQGGPRDVVALADAVDAIPRIRSLLGEARDVPALWALRDRAREMPELAGRIRDAIVDEPPAAARDGGIFRPGRHEELDRLRDAAGRGRTWIASYQEGERERTGIKSLKVRYNKVFGYYIEVTRPNLSLVPEHYRRKQTMANAERFVTDDLKAYESRIVGAEERARELEIELFQELRAQIAEALPEVQQAARALAQLDALAALAEIGAHRGYCLPEVDDGDTISIVEGRHPVIERALQGERFVPNNTLLDRDANQILVITGPNMAGKSTYIRQVALLVLMAQMGSMIPARRARVGVVDRVFTRVGASDDLAGGRSTFMVEMHETANILNNATSKSLVVLDEIGRGTSTFDGISIAWAVAEHLHENPSRRARTLFATHYHELTDLARSMSGVKNYNVAVRESQGRVTFLRKIVPGPADRSYGIHVARLAGLPGPVVARAEEILRTLEEGELTDTGQPRLARRRHRAADASGRQLPLFAPPPPAPSPPRASD